eukprot:789275-Alexandrium_andersonii.AAC.1
MRCAAAALVGSSCRSRRAGRTQEQQGPCCRSCIARRSAVPVPPQLACQCGAPPQGAARGPAVLAL